MSVTESYRIVFSKRVARNLEQIFDHIATDSPTNAAKMVGRIVDSIATLEIFPHRTRVEAEPLDMKHPVRSLPVWPYIVFFRVYEEHRIVRILQIRHGARLPPKRFD